MEKVRINLINSLDFYNKCLLGNVNENSLRYGLMQPMKTMWDYLNVPLKTTQPNGYDVVMASEMLGIWTPRKSTQQVKDNLPKLIESKIFDEYQEVILKGIHEFEKIDYSIPLKKIDVNILLGDEESQEMKVNKGYSGFGGIPGYIMLMVIPNDFNKKRLKSALAQEFNHNVRFTFEPFNYGDVTVEEYLVLEGLAECFAEEMYGKELIGPWIADFDKEEMAYSIEVIKEGRKTKGFGEVSAYMFGDGIAKKRGFNPVGLSENAGYTIGYHLIKQYLANSSKSIAEATLTPTEEIIRVSKFFD
ncbi:DUF2268 domain-containing protein [Lysinibacillus agricola]|uniref:DUF2268 domain-containing protein n=1 Tax=Lysinibacillus agricola TaxID=2590012 RepID=A0ABX7AKX1_9BACI|nr:MULTISPECIES: DUF2268 domain-containing protein [Lysinibacillus]KOS59783.1 hypothetical protein AN161_26835 [Lysinibacillus sp. FJAT-14222]QQP10389.1 DUF2268 domain-containing protein [Lysinibacillus agricola]